MCVDVGGWWRSQLLRGGHSALGAHLGMLSSDPVSTADHRGPGSQTTAGSGSGGLHSAPSLGGLTESQPPPASSG